MTLFSSMKIVDKDGKVTIEANKNRCKPFCMKRHSSKTEMLKGGRQNNGGTSQAPLAFKLFDYDTEFGGKTGTSSHHSDAWYVGNDAEPYRRCLGWRRTSKTFTSRRECYGIKVERHCRSTLLHGKVLADPSLQYRGKFPLTPKVLIERPYDLQ